jgi:hypothetical protein
MGDDQSTPPELDERPRDATRKRRVAGEPQTDATHSTDPSPPTLTVAQLQEIAGTEKKKRQDADRSSEEQMMATAMQRLEDKNGCFVVVCIAWVIILLYIMQIGYLHYAFDIHGQRAYPSPDDYPIIAAAMKFDNLRLGDPIPTPQTGRVWTMPPPYIAVPDTRPESLLPRTFVHTKVRVKELEVALHTYMYELDEVCVVPAVFTSPWNALLIRDYPAVLYNVYITERGDALDMVRERSYGHPATERIHFLANTIVIRHATGILEINNSTIAHCVQKFHG